MFIHMNTWIVWKDLRKLHFQWKLQWIISDITDEDYIHAQKVFKEFEIKSLGEYLDLYVQSDTLLLAVVFENFRKNVLKYVNLILLIFLSAPGLAKLV